MKEQCFLVREDRRGRGVTVLRRDKTEMLRYDALEQFNVDSKAEYTA